MKDTHSKSYTDGRSESVGFGVGGSTALEPKCFLMWCWLTLAKMINACACYVDPHVGSCFRSGDAC